MTSPTPTKFNHPLLYPLFKMSLGLVCFILSVEYAIAYVHYNESSFGILYVGDCATWFMASLILFFEGVKEAIEYLATSQV